VPDTPSVKHGIVRPSDGDFVNTWPATTRAVVDWVDDNIATFSEESPRPAAGVSGRWHRDPADGTLSFDTGAAWVEVPYGSIAARLSAGGEDPLTVTAAMLAADVPVLNIGDQVPTARQVLPASGKFAWCDGGLIDRTVYAAFFAAVGHAYNGGVDPGGNLVKLPDKRGRGLLGARDMGTGAATITAFDRANVARGGKGGVSDVALSVAQMPSHTHPSAVGATSNFDANANETVTLLKVTQVANTATGPTGGGGTHSNLGPYEADNWMVRIA
jgi:microcystin-dependent protein